MDPLVCLTSSPGWNRLAFAPFPVLTTSPEKSRPGINGNSEPFFNKPCIFLTRFNVEAPYPPSKIEKKVIQFISFAVIV